MKSAIRWFCAILFVILFTISSGMLLFMAAAFGFGTAPTVLLLIIGLLLTGMHYAKRASAGNRAQRRWTTAFRYGVACLILFPIGLRYYLQIPPSDQSMLADFNKHEATFNQLVAMANADSNLGELGEDWVEYADPNGKKITPQRINLYRGLEKQVNVGLWHDQTGEMEFEGWRADFGLDGCYLKGYVYLPTPPKKTYPQLDGFPFTNTAPSQTVYRHIQGHWYLYYEVIYASF